MRPKEKERKKERLSFATRNIVSFSVGKGMNFWATKVKEEMKVRSEKRRKRQ